MIYTMLLLHPGNGGLTHAAGVCDADTYDVFKPRDRIGGGDRNMSPSRISIGVCVAEFYVGGKHSTRRSVSQGHIFVDGYRQIHSSLRKRAIHLYVVLKTRFFPCAYKPCVHVLHTRRPSTTQSPWVRPSCSPPPLLPLIARVIERLQR